jgi:UbiD family decarboxylase
MKFKEFLREEYALSYIDPINKDRVEVFHNPVKKELKGFMRAMMCPSGNWFMTREETLHDHIAVKIKENMPELSKDVYNCIYVVMIWEEGKLIINPASELEEDDIENYHNIINKCLKDKGIQYKVEEET